MNTLVGRDLRCSVPLRSVEQWFDADVLGHPAGTFKKGPTGCLQTSASSHYSTLRSGPVLGHPPGPLEDGTDRMSPNFGIKLLLNAA